MLKFCCLVKGNFRDFPHFVSDPHQKTFVRIKFEINTVNTLQLQNPCRGDKRRIMIGNHAYFGKNQPACLVIKSQDFIRLLSQSKQLS